MSRDPIHLPLPVDSGNFLRRGCRNCGREFKRQLRPGQPAPPEGGYYCPYCSARADEAERFTDEQLQFAYRLGLARRLPELRERELAAYEGDPADFKSDLDYLESLEPLTEPDDMKVWVLECHPEDPLKIAEDWPANVGCLVCGRRT